jgi:hypothetical protein
VKPEPKCLRGCDERHDDECPVPEWEAEYWFRYFGSGDRAVHAAMKPHTQEDYEAAWREKQEANK